MTKLILLRHGQSAWNIQHRFTGWVDVDLTEQGEAQARRGGRADRRARDRDRSGVRLGADPRDPHGQSRAGRRGTILGPDGQGLAAERAPLRRPHRPHPRRGGGDPRQGAGADLAPILRRPAAAAGPRRRIRLRPRPSLRRDHAARGRKPEADAGAGAALLGERHRPASARGRDRDGRGARQFSARDRQASVRGVGRGDPGVEIPTGNPLLVELDGRPGHERRLSRRDRRPRRCRPWRPDRGGSARGHSWQSDLGEDVVVGVVLRARPGELGVGDGELADLRPDGSCESPGRFRRAIATRRAGPARRGRDRGCAARRRARRGHRRTARAGAHGSRGRASPPLEIGRLFAIGMVKRREQKGRRVVRAALSFKQV